MTYELSELLKWKVGVHFQTHRTYRTEILLNNLVQRSFLQIYNSLNTYHGYSTSYPNNYIVGYCDHLIFGPRGLSKTYYK